MCDVCNHTPCLSACPNAGDPPVVGRCCLCHDPIYAGDEYAVYQSHEYCEPCLDDMPTCRLVQLFGGDWKIGEADLYKGPDPDLEYERMREERMFSA